MTETIYLHLDCVDEPNPYWANPDRPTLSARLAMEVIGKPQDAGKKPQKIVTPQAYKCLFSAEKVDFCLYEWDVSTSKLKRKGALTRLGTTPKSQCAAFCKWLENQQARTGMKDFFTTVNLGGGVVYADKARARDYIRAASSWPAPLPQALRLNHVLEDTDNQIDGLNGQAYLVPWFRKDSPPESIDASEVQGQDDVLELAPYSAFEDHEVVLRTNAVEITDFTDLNDALGGLDPETGFFKCPTDAGQVSRLIRKFEGEASAQLWSLSALLSLEPDEILQLAKTDQNKFWLAGWFGVAGAAAALDPIMSGFARLVASAETDMKPSAEIVRFARAVNEGFAEVSGGTGAPVDGDFEDFVVTAIRKCVSEFALLHPSSDADSVKTDLIEFLGFRETSEDEHEDVLYKAITQFAADPPAELALERVLSALGALASLLHDENGTEAVLKRLFARIVFSKEGSGIVDGPLYIKLTQSTGSTWEGDAKAKLALSIRQAWQAFTTYLDGEFDGAQSIRTAMGAELVKRLTVRGAKTTQAAFKTGLAESDMFSVRFGKAEPQPIDPIAQQFVAYVKRFWRPEITLPNGDHQTDFENALFERLQQHLTDRTEDLFETSMVLRLAAPDSAPQPLPIMIGASMDPETFETFDERFNGIGVLIRRTVSDDTSNPWIHASRINADIEGTDLGSTIRPEIPPIADGRCPMFLHYHGMSLASPAFDQTLADPKALDGPEAVTPFFTLTDVEGGEQSFSKLPVLAYGRTYETLAFGVTNAGSVPSVLQNTNPWKVREVKSVEGVVSFKATLKRRTMIGSLGLEEKPGQPARLGTIPEGVIPLSEDYPRQVLCMVDGKTEALDLFRNSDGTGAIQLSEAKKEIKLTEAVVWAAQAGGKRKLITELYKLELEKGVVVAKLVPGAEQQYDLTVTFSVQSIKIILPKSSDAEAAPDGSERYWIRLSLESESENDTFSFSFEDTRGNDQAQDFYAKPERASVLVVAPDPPKDKQVWDETKQGPVSFTVRFPRVPFADFEFWMAAPEYREKVWGNDTVDYLQDDGKADEKVALHDLMFEALTYANVLRGLDEEIATRLNALPDFAVDAVRVRAELQDAVTTEHGKTAASVLKKFVHHKLLDDAWMPKSDQEDAVKNLSDWTLTDFRTLLEHIDHAYRFNVTVKVAGNTVEIDKPNPDISINVPCAASTKISLQTCVRTSLFESRIDPLVKEYGKSDAGNFLYFPGASFIVEAVHDGLAGNVREKLNDIIKIETGKTERRYTIVAKGKIAPDSPWRLVSRIDTLTQRWRFSGRPIYLWPDLDAFPNRECGNSVLDLSQMPDGTHKAALTLFEQEAFFDRADTDADRQSFRLDPLSFDGSTTPVQTIEWYEPTATLFRHRFEYRSRYAGMMAPKGAARVRSWEKNESVPLAAWAKHVVMLADPRRIELNRPRVRVLLPMMTAPDDETNGTPPLLCVLEEPPFAEGGLADRVAIAIKTGIGYGFKAEGDAPVPPVQPIDTRKEFGPDPRLALTEMNPKTALGIAVHQEGPIGLSFDSAFIGAREWANSQYLATPVFVGLDPVEESYEEHFSALTFHRYLDPGWVVKVADSTAPPTTIPATRHYQLTIGGCCTISIGDDANAPHAIFKVRRCENEFSVSVVNRAVDETPQAESELELCRFVAPEVPNLLFHHLALGDGRYSASILRPGAAKPDGFTAASGVSSQPQMMASIEWGVPKDWQVKDGTGARTLKLNGAVIAVKPLSASGQTSAEWGRTARAGDALYSVKVNGIRSEPEQVPIDFMFDGKAISAKRSGGSEPVWLCAPEQFVTIPRTMHRSLAMIITKRSRGSAPHFERFETVRLVRGRQIPYSPELKDHEFFARIAELETPALPLCNENAPVLEQFRYGYFDLVATGGQQDEFLDFEVRFADDPNTSIEVIERLTFKIRHLTSESAPEAAEPSADATSNMITFKLEWDAPAGLASETIHALLLTYQKGRAVTARAITGRGDVVPLTVVMMNQGALTAQSDRPDGLALSYKTDRTEDAELWTSVSLRHSASRFDDDEFDFDQLFSQSGSNTETVAAQTGAEALKTLNEAQARIIAMSAPHPIV